MRATSTVRLFRRALTNSTALVAIALRPAAALRMVPAASPFPSIHDLAVGLVAFGMESAAALSTPLGRAARVMAASAVVTLLPLGISDRSGTAYAMGGAGSAGNMTYGGSGGADSETGGGGAGHPGVQAGGGGGGGGAGLTGANGGSGVNYGENYGGDTPGAGGAGGRTGENGSRNGAGGGNATNNGGSGAGGGGGGGGATGYSSLGSEPALPSAELGAVAGGTGGQGGTGVHVGGGGGGGGGGYGAIITGNGTDLGTLTVNITGGNGGQGGSGYRGGNGGTGGTGLTIDGATFTNDATIMGGTGGGGGTGSNMDGSAGASGAGISGSSLTITDTANGRIVGGGTGAAQSDAIIFTSGTNVLNYGGTIIGNLAITAAGTTLQINASAAGSTVANVITGGGAIIQNSPNTLALTGVNTYTGGTTIAQGILQVSAVPQTLTSMSLGTGSVLLNGGTLQAAPQDNGGGENTGPATSNYNFALQNDIQIGTSSRIDVNGNSLTLSGNITDRVAGTGTLTVINSGGNGSQALTLSGDNTFAGGLIVGGSAVVRLGASNAAGSGALAIDADAALDLNANDQSITALTGSGAIGNSSGASSSTLAVGSGAFAGTIADGFSGAAGGRVALAKMSDGTVTGGTLVLTGANTYTGGTTVAGGTLQIGNGGTAGSIAGNVVDNAALAFARSDVFTYGGVVSGTGSLTQAGPGTLVLTGANTYTGGTTVAGGTLQIGNGGTAGSIAGNVVDNAALAFARSDVFTYGGVVSGTGSLTQAGPGTLVLTGANTYTGGTTVAGGTLQIGNGGTAGSIAGNVVDNAALAFARSDVFTYGGVVSGTGSLTQAGPGTLVLTGANTYTGGTTVAGGTLQIGNGGAAGSIAGNVVDNAALAFARSDVFTYGGVVSGTGSLTQAGPGTLVLTGANTYTGGTTVAGGTLQIGNGGTAGSIAGNVVDNAALAFARSDVFTYGGVVSGTGSLTQAGPGTLVLTGANTYTGGTTVAGGTLQIGNGGTAGSIAGNVVDNAALAFARSDVFTYGGVVSGTGSLTQAGPGTLVLTGANTYTGGTTVAGGTLQIGNGGTAGSIAGNVVDNAALAFARSDVFTYGGVVSGTGSLTQAGPGTLVLTGANTYTGGTTVAGGTLQIGNGGTAGSIAGNVVDNAALAFARSDVFTYGGVMSGTGSLTQAGPGTLVLTGANTYTGGTTVAGGTLQIGNGGTAGSIAGNVVDNAALAFARSDVFTYGGVVSGTGSLTQAGPGTLVLTGANTYTGGTTVAGGTLQIGNGGTAGSIAGNVVDNAALAFARSDVFTYGGVVSGTGSLTQAGPGTLVLTGANTYTGGTTVAGGTLQIGNGGTAGSIAGNVVDNAALAFARSDVFTYGGVVSGTGSLTQAGPGTLVLTGANTYTGGTTVALGSTLALAGRGSIAASSFVANDGTLDLSASAKASFGSLGGSGMVALGPQALTLTNAFGTFSGAISGSGSLAIQSGKEVLTGTNTYTGASTVAFGSTLQLGDGGSAGSIIGPVVDEGTLAFARRDSSTYAGAISGAGAVVKAGAGTLTLSGANTYAGGTLLRQGALAIGSGTALGTGRLAMDDGTALRFTAPDVKLGNSIALTGIADPTINTGSYTATLTGDIAGEGALTKQGNGTLILLGTDTATGATRVAAGTLEVDGSAAATAVTVGNGATLSGTGSVGSIAAGAGATVSPGSAANPYGVLRTPGSAAFVKTATYRVAIDATGQNSALAVNGTATLGAAAVTVASTPGAYNAATRYTILTAAGGVQGVFGTLTTAQALAFLSPYLTYTADAVTLNFRTNGTSFADIATTPNERSAALAIQSLDPNGALARSLQGLSPDAARRALDVLAGATHASAATTAVQDTRRVSTQILDRLWNIGGGEIDARTLLQQLGSPSPLPAFVNCFAPVEVPPPRTPPTIVTAWGEAFGDFGHDGADRNGAGLDRKLGGFVVGYDAPLHGLGTPVRVGVAGGYTGNTFSGSGSGGASSAGSFESVFVSLYGGARFGAVDLRGGTAVAGTSTTVNRTVAYPGFLEAEHSVYGGNTEQVFGEVGYRFSGTRWVVEPIANAAYIHVHQDGYRERGGAAALVGFGQDEDVGTTTLGARGEYAPFVGVPLVGRAFLGWRHAFGDVNPASRLAFEAGSIPFTSQGAALDRNALASEAGLDWRLSEAVTLGVAYIGQVGPRDIDNGVKGRMEVKF